MKTTVPVRPLWEIAWRFLEKLKKELPCEPAIPLLGVSPQEVMTSLAQRAASPCSRQRDDTEAGYVSTDGSTDREGVVRVPGRMRNRVREVVQPRGRGNPDFCGNAAGP